MRLLLLPLLALGAQLELPAGGDLSAYDLNRIQVGREAPDFNLRSADRKTVSLADFRGKIVVLVFYRGYW